MHFIKEKKPSCPLSLTPARAISKGSLTYELVLAKVTSSGSFHECQSFVKAVRVNPVFSDNHEATQPLRALLRFYSISVQALLRQSPVDSTAAYPG